MVDCKHGHSSYPCLQALLFSRTLPASPTSGRVYVMSPPLEYQQGLWTTTEHSECDICYFRASTSRSFIHLCPIPCEQVQANLRLMKDLWLSHPVITPAIRQPTSRSRTSLHRQEAGIHCLVSQVPTDIKLFQPLGFEVICHKAMDN